ncbi:MAG: twin-arginine translocase TatA/TatE family subunit [Cyanobacteriota bacterium]|jgi:sec-independent protein translocase protein TatA|nr:twin-arginine translocase TatA/TatE family subunit [Cyanobacteriota bacterium]
MFNLGWTEVVLVIGVALLIFGPKKIPQLGSALGKTLRGFKEEMNSGAELDSASEDYDDAEDADVYR